jgi:dipeptidyl aminopeptidase/acylaminoacyl peptidase
MNGKFFYLIREKMLKMSKKTSFSLLLLLALAMYGIAVVRAQSSQLIPREVFFGASDKKGQPRLSPNGKYFTYLAPVNTVFNIWIKTVDNNDDKVLTHDTDRGIHGYWWSYDNKRLFYVQDTAGNENWRLYSVSVEDGTIKEYTPFEGVQVRLIDYQKEFPDRMLIGLNKRDPKVHDVYELNTTTGDLKLVIENPGNVASWISNHKLEILGKVEPRSDGGHILFIRDAENLPWREFILWTIEDGEPGETYFSKDGKYLYCSDPRNNNTCRFVKIDLQTGHVTELASDPEYDIHGSVLLDKDTFELLALSYEKDRKHWVFFDPATEKTFSELRTLDHGEMSIVNRTQDNAQWIVAFVKDNGPVAFWLYDRNKQEAKFLFDHQPIYKKYELSSMEPIQFHARDGLLIHGYLTLPNSGKKTNLPLVLNVHGGPWLRDGWGLDTEVQWLANRGYAVLQVNYRGSIGYGKAFLNAGNKQWGRAMQDDLTDAVHWAINCGIADPNRVAIYGGSYGGYAALAGATFTPDLYCCAVDIVGVSNIFSFIESVPPYWALFLHTLKIRVGDPENDKDLLRLASPLFSVDAIKIPILIAQGANDPRVKQAESEQIVEAMKKKGLEYEYLLFPDEGHGFVKPENNLKFYKAAEAFLAKHLGGRYEP